MPQAEVLGWRAHEKFGEDGALTDEATGAYLGKDLAAFALWVERFRGG